MIFTLEQLQIEHKPWADKNFGLREPWQPFAGMVEEIGELEEAIENKDEKEIKDSLADIVIFMVDFCNQLNLNLDTIAFIKLASPIFRTRGVIIGRLAHSFLKMSQNIRGTQEEHKLDITLLISELYENLYLFSLDRYSVSLLEFIEQTWNVVKLRDWTKNKITGV